MRIVTVIGARPQFIKAAAVSRQLRRWPDAEEILVHTGQHYDANMSDVFFEELELPQPRHCLGIGSGPHGDQTGRMLAAIEKVLLQAAPQWVLVYGDTNSTLAGALAAAKLHIPVAHVEAGLRSFNRKMPEEINRVMTDHLSSILLAPTLDAVTNLRNEGIAGGHVDCVGDVMYDVVLSSTTLAERRHSLQSHPGLLPGGYVLATVHRAENTDSLDRLQNILAALNELARDLPVVLPLHPRTRAVLERQGLVGGSPNLRLIEPVGYLEMIVLEKNSRLIVTDSGGVQKEAFFHGVPCVTLRDETEWVELLACGWNRLAPPIDAGQLLEQIRAALAFDVAAQARPLLYGDGQAARRIAARLHDPQLRRAAA